ncbi:hypothetical protein BKA82DRAFT_20620 [Pisolithus tinctorius]|uniref:Uncharacterized protein n=1 Tax=Pisolithus tinctorius Marx 270 TaxID=870435 RepID=A0A0C3KND2_PISTI|nr:hypothetical protein BKA82DRAFT_20620 [Pisolithus tinctorius]KIO11107.1 hypothetical protein M404DRAFT_20620 [Pisolithus tinctorius Marx 270]
MSFGQHDGPAITVSAGTTLDVPRSLWARSASACSFDEPISISVQHEQEDNIELLQMDSQWTKHLKLYVKTLCEAHQIPDKTLMDFIDTGNVFYMLIDIKAHLVKSEVAQKSTQFQTLQEALRGKDFEAGLHTHLVACMLSPNLMAYVTDTQQHIMEFISEHPDMFKVLAAVLDDAELKGILGKLVMKSLAAYHVNCEEDRIIDVTKVLVRSSSGMETEVSHWNRVAFLIFLIRTSDHHITSLDACYMAHLLPMLKSDMHAKIQQDMGKDLDDPKEQTQEGDREGQGDGIGDVCVTAATEDLDGSFFNDTTPLEDDADSPVDGKDSNADGIDDLNNDNSGFGLNGKLIWFNHQKFWNYVDYMLALLRNTSRKATNLKEDYEKEINRYVA